MQQSSRCEHIKQSPDFKSSKRLLRCKSPSALSQRFFWPSRSHSVRPQEPLCALTALFRAFALSQRSCHENDDVDADGGNDDVVARAGFIFPKAPRRHASVSRIVPPAFLHIARGSRRTLSVHSVHMRCALKDCWAYIGESIDGERFPCHGHGTDFQVHAPCSRDALCRTVFLAANYRVATNHTWGLSAPSRTSPQHAAATGFETPDAVTSNIIAHAAQ